MCVCVCVCVCCFFVLVVFSSIFEHPITHTHTYTHTHTRSLTQSFCIFFLRSTFTNLLHLHKFDRGTATRGMIPPPARPWSARSNIINNNAYKTTNAVEVFYAEVESDPCECTSNVISTVGDVFNLPPFFVKWHEFN